MPEEVKPYVEAAALTSTNNGERGRIFDPAKRVKEAVARLTGKETKLNKDFIVEEMSILMNQDFDSDPGNRERVLSSVTRNDELVERLNDEITREFSTEEARNMAGALTELYIHSLKFYLAFDDTESSRAKGENQYNRSDLLTNSGRY